MQPIFATDLTILPSNKIITGKVHDSNQTGVGRQLLYIYIITDCVHYCVMCRDADASPIYTFMHDGFY